MQAWKLSAVGIPIGLIFGYLAGFCMSPSLTADAQISAQAGKTAQTVVSANPLIFFAAALLTLLTVYLSSLQACKMVEKMCIRDRLQRSHDWKICICGCSRRQTWKRRTDNMRLFRLELKRILIFASLIDNRCV